MSVQIFGLVIMSAGELRDLHRNYASREKNLRNQRDGHARRAARRLKAVEDHQRLNTDRRPFIQELLSTSPTYGTKHPTKEDALNTVGG